MKGSCHCGNIHFEVEGAPTQAMSCNCSMCQRKGMLMWFVPNEQFHLQTPESDLSVYTFNKHVIKHHFCAKCGIHTHGEGTDQKGNRMAAVNVRVLEGIDLDAITVTHFDGRSH